MQATESPQGHPPAVAEVRQNCTVCRGNHLFPFLDLGTMPPANALRHRGQLALPEPTYPLGLTACLDCHLIQLTHSVPAPILFKDYVYFSSISKAMVLHFAELAHDVVARFVPQQGLVVEIGSNDGILLQSLVGKPYRILGVDPADTAAAQARERGVPTLVDFFNAKVAARIKAEYGPASAILGNNVLAHIPDLHETMRGFDVLAADDGVLVFEFPYVVDFYNHREFDTVYHEHLYYFGLRPLMRLLEEYRFKLFDIIRSDVHGGSIRVFAARQAAGRDVTAAVATALAEEDALALDQPANLERFAKDAVDIRTNLRNLLRRLKEEGHRVVGYTAPAKGNVLLNYCNIGTDVLPYLADATPAKQGLYNPGMHIPIVSPEQFQADAPSHALLLAWNHQVEILKREQAWRDGGGKFIVPIPSVRIV